MTIERRDRRYFRCEGCGDLTWCRRLATGVWECGGCIEHDLGEFEERDRTERRVRSRLEETSMDTRPITMAERIKAVARRRGYTEADLADVCKHHEVQILARAEARDEQQRERDAIEADVAAVGRELGLDPAANYHDRCRVFTELARRGHAIAAERYGRPA
jgi:hypothetical protein